MAGAFGQRRFLGLTAVFLVGLAALLEPRAPRRARVALLAAVAVAIWWNLGADRAVRHRADGSPAARARPQRLPRLRDDPGPCPESGVSLSVRAALVLPGHARALTHEHRASALRILYLADIRFPLERANGIQTIQTCHALARRGHEVTLLVRPDTTTPAARSARLLRPAAALVVASGARPRRRTGDSATRPLPGARRCAQPGQPAPDVVLTRDLGVAAALAAPATPPASAARLRVARLRSDCSALLPALLSSAPAASSSQVAAAGAPRAPGLERADGLRHDHPGARRRPGGAVRRRGRASRSWPTAQRSTPSAPSTGKGRSGRAWVTYAGHLYPWKGVDVLR